MRPRAIGDLAQLDDPAFLATIAEGLSLILSHVERLLDAALIAPGQPRHSVAAPILLQFAEEEVAKFLILIDAVRCARQKGKLLSEHLKNFNIHLARGLYAKAYYWRPANFAEVQKAIDDERKAHFLDGPTGVDWIFRNQTLTQREEALYVDYVETDQGHIWVSPERRATLEHPWFARPSPAYRVAKSLECVGLISKEGLRVIADIWRAVEIKSQMSWHDIERLNHKTIHEAQSRHIASGVSVRRTTPTALSSRVRRCAH